MLKRYATPALLLGMVLNVTGCTTASHTQHNAAHVTSPDQYRVLLENDHRDETVYFQKGGSLRITLPGGDAMDVTVPDGHVMWHEAWSHQVTNTGTQPVMAIIVEEKP